MNTFITAGTDRNYNGCLFPGVHRAVPTATFRRTGAAPGHMSDRYSPFERSDRRGSAGTDPVPGETERSDGPATPDRSTAPGTDVGSNGPATVAEYERHYGVTIESPGEVATLQRLEQANGTETVRKWAEEGIPIDAMGSKSDMAAYRKREGTPVPWDVEQRNERSRRRNTAAQRVDGPAGETSTTPAELRTALSSPGRKLDEDVKTTKEAQFGSSFDHVRIHEGPRATAATDAIDAEAATVGNHILVNDPEFDPESPRGDYVLTHELAHVEQQTDRAVSRLPKDDAGLGIGPDAAPAVDPGQLEIDPDPVLEREAREATAAVAGGERVDVTGRSVRPHVQRAPPGQVARQRARKERIKNEDNRLHDSFKQQLDRLLEHNRQIHRQFVDLQARQRGRAGPTDHRFNAELSRRQAELNAKLGTVQEQVRSAARVMRDTGDIDGGPFFDYLGRVMDADRTVIQYFDRDVLEAAKQRGVLDELRERHAALVGELQRNIDRIYGQEESARTGEAGREAEAARQRDEARRTGAHVSEINRHENSRKLSAHRVNIHDAHLEALRTFTEELDDLERDRLRESAAETSRWAERFADLEAQRGQYHSQAGVYHRLLAFLFASEDPSSGRFISSYVHRLGRTIDVLTDAKRAEFTVRQNRLGTDPVLTREGKARQAQIKAGEGGLLTRIEDLEVQKRVDRVTNPLLRERPEIDDERLANEVWRRAEEEARARGDVDSEGRPVVRDPRPPHLPVTWDRTEKRGRQWRLGHKPGLEWRHLLRLFGGEVIDRRQLLEIQSDPEVYRVEHPDTPVNDELEGDHWPDYLARKYGIRLPGAAPPPAQAGPITGDDAPAETTVGSLPERAPPPGQQGAPAQGPPPLLQRVGLAGAPDPVPIDPGLHAQVVSDLDRIRRRADTYDSVFERLVNRKLQEDVQYIEQQHAADPGRVADQFRRARSSPEEARGAAEIERYLLVRALRREKLHNVGPNARIAVREDAMTDLNDALQATSRGVSDRIAAASGRNDTRFHRELVNAVVEYTNRSTMKSFQVKGPGGGEIPNDDDVRTALFPSLLWGINTVAKTKQRERGARYALLSREQGSAQSRRQKLEQLRAHEQAQGEWTRNMLLAKDALVWKEETTRDTILDRRSEQLYEFNREELRNLVEKLKELVGRYRRR